jgi:hypothetical protein
MPPSSALTAGAPGPSLFTIRYTLLLSVKGLECLQFHELALVLLTEAWLKVRVGHLFETQAKVRALMDTLYQEFLQGL